MGYYDGFTANLFGRTRDGRRVFAPFGRLGGVYEVPSDADAARITRAVQRTYAAMLAVVVASLVVAGPRGYWVAVPLIVAGFVAALARLTRGLPRSPVGAADLVRVPRAEAVARSGRATGRPTLIRLLVTALALTAAGVWMWTQDRELAGLLVAGFFGLCAALFAYQLAAARDR